MSLSQEVKANVITVRPDGPLVCEGDITLQDAEGKVLLKDSEAWLCRCGHSKNKPFCDGAHKDCNFEDDAVFGDEKQEALENETGALTLTLKPNAMLIMKGPVTIRSKNGESVTTRNRGALCRCGESNKKPFCDASHRKCGFEAE